MAGIKKLIAAMILAGMVLVPCLAMAEEAGAPPAAAATSAPAPSAQAPAAPAAAAAPAPAPAPKVDTGDTAWMLISTALVMLMTPGLAFFYGGLVRRKNMLSVLMQCLMILCLISLPSSTVMTVSWSAPAPSVIWIRSPSLSLSTRMQCFDSSSLRVYDFSPISGQ